MDDIITLTGGGTVFAFRPEAPGGPRLVYWGHAAAFEPHHDPEPRPRPAAPDLLYARQLFPLLGDGFTGEPALLAHREGGSAVFAFERTDVSTDSSAAIVHMTDTQGGVKARLRYEVCAESGVLAASAELVNCSSTRVMVQRLNALTLPLPLWATHTEQFYGEWSGEGRRFRAPLTAGKSERVQRGGRPGFDGGPFFLLCEENTRENTGRSAGLALAHSGNHVLGVERFGDGAGQAFLAEWLFPGEATLAPGETYATPMALAAISDRGTGGVSNAYHQFARRAAPNTRTNRPVQLNTWEAAYFNITESEAKRLANEAAAIGAERFVLDDGWFRGRRHDRAGLGDWTPDPQIFPDGLAPLADHVNGLGMEFGLWVEPEMVNEDSELYRAHPDWILTAAGAGRPTGRNQLVLDMTRKDVREHIFGQIDAILKSAPIAYLKWDCNRDLYPAEAGGKPVASKQIAGVYSLMERLRAAHPLLSIESCASGGGRIDFGVLKYTDRFWTSDATDALERVRIQRTASLFMPPELLGAHVGPSPNPWTGRRLSMAFRCLTAMFGHFGVELDPAKLDSFERHVLMRAIALYKDIRPMLIHGALVRCEAAEPGLDVQYVMDQATGRAVVRLLRTEEPVRHVPPPVLIERLPAGVRWKVWETRIDGADSVEPVEIRSSESLGESGFVHMPRHAGEGRLFMLERV